MINESNNMYDFYLKSLSLYIIWIKEQIDKSKKGYIRVRRGDLALAMRDELGIRYKNRRFDSLYRIIRVVLFNEGIFTELGHWEDRDRIFILRKRKEGDILIPSLCDLDKKLKIMVNSEITQT